MISVSCARGLAAEAVRESAEVVACIRVVEASLTLERRLAARNTVLGHRDRQQGIAHGGAFADRASAAASALQIAARQIDALGDGAVDLLGVQTHELRRGNRGAEDTEDRDPRGSLDS